MKIYLPNDADGNVITSNVKVMYEKDGTVRRVDDMIYLINSKKWRVLSGPLAFEPDELYLTSPDSWEKLEENLDRCIETNWFCCYYNENKDCQSCPIYGNNQNGCISKVFKSIKQRIRKLSGEDND